MQFKILKKFCSSKIISNTNKIKIIGYPFAGGQNRDGVEDTPTWLFEQNWFKRLQEENQIKSELIKLEIKEAISQVRSEKRDIGEALNYKNVIKSSMQLCDAVDQSLQEENFTIVIGGDHSQAIGSIQGVKSQYKDCKVIWIDAHIDCNTPNSSPSGNMHGMPLAFLSGFVEGYQQCMAIKDVCYMGIRSYEEDEKLLIDQNEILVFQVQDCSNQNIKNIIHKIKQKYVIHNNINKSQQLWISFDIDAICSNEFESTGTAEADGISIEFINQFFQEILQENVIGIDISEINFSKSKDSKIIKRDQKSFQKLLINIIKTIKQKNSQNQQ